METADQEIKEASGDYLLAVFGMGSGDEMSAGVSVPLGICWASSTN